MGVTCERAPTICIKHFNCYALHSKPAVTNFVTYLRARFTNLKGKCEEDTGWVQLGLDSSIYSLMPAQAGSWVGLEVFIIVGIRPTVIVLL